MRTITGFEPMFVAAGATGGGRSDTPFLLALVGTKLTARKATTHESTLLLDISLQFGPCSCPPKYSHLRPAAINCAPQVLG